MKRIEIKVSGVHEEDIGHEILQGVYEAVKNHGYTDVSVSAESVVESMPHDIQVPEFLKQYAKRKADGTCLLQGRC